MNNKLYYQIKKIANKYGMGHMSEDITQEVELARFRGRKANNQQLVVDYLRSQFGRKFNTQKMDEMIGWSMLEENSATVENKDAYWNVFLNNLSQKDRSLLVMKFEWDLTEREIGHAFGISEGRVSQILKELKTKLKKQLQNESI